MFSLREGETAIAHCRSTVKLTDFSKEASGVHFDSHGELFQLDLTHHVTCLQARKRRTHPTRNSQRATELLQGCYIEHFEGVTDAICNYDGRHQKQSARMPYNSLFRSAAETLADHRIRAKIAGQDTARGPPRMQAD